MRAVNFLLFQLFTSQKPDELILGGLCNTLFKVVDFLETDTFN